MKGERREPEQAKEMTEPGDQGPQRGITFAECSIPPFRRDSLPPRDGIADRRRHRGTPFRFSQLILSPL